MEMPNTLETINGKSFKRIPKELPLHLNDCRDYIMIEALNN